MSREFDYVSYDLNFDIYIVDILQHFDFDYVQIHLLVLKILVLYLYLNSNIDLLHSILYLESCDFFVLYGGTSFELPKISEQL